MGATLVQKKGAQSPGNVSSLSVTLDAPPTAGNLLVAACNSDATVATPAGFTLAVSAVSGQGLYIFYRVVQPGDGDTVAFAPSVADSVAGGVLEYSGIVTSSPLDQTASNTVGGSPSSISTGTTGTTGQANELIIVVVGPHANNNHPWVLSSWSAGYTSQIEEPEGLAVPGSASSACHIADRIVSAVGTYSATGTWSPASSDAGAAIATFKALAATTVAVGVASEADTAQPIKPLRIRTLGRAQETDTAQQIRPQRTRTVGLAAEVDAAVAIRPMRVHTLGIATEATTAFAAAHSKALTLGLATETDIALSISPALSSVVGFDSIALGNATTGWQAGAATTGWQLGTPTT